MVFLDYIINSIKGYFFNHEALDYIDEQVTWKTALINVWIINIILTLTLSLISITLSVQEIINPLFGIRQEYVSIISTIFFYPIGVFIGFGIIYLMLKLFGGKGSFFNTLKFGLSVGVFPLLYFNSLLILIILIPSMAVGLSLLFSLSGLIFFFWSLAIILKVYSAVHQIGQWRTFFALSIIPILLVIIYSIIGFQTWNETYKSGLSPQISDNSGSQKTINSVNSNLEGEKLNIFFTYSGYSGTPANKIGFDENSIISSNFGSCSPNEIKNLNTLEKGTEVSFQDNQKGQLIFSCDDNVKNTNYLEGSTRVQIINSRTGLEIPFTVNIITG